MSSNGNTKARKATNRAFRERSKVIRIMSLEKYTPVMQNAILQKYGGWKAYVKAMGG